MNLIATPAQVGYTPAATAIVHNAQVGFTSRLPVSIVHLVQYDVTIPIVAVALMANGQPYTVPSSAAVNVRLAKPDGTYVYNPALGVSEDGQTAYIAITAQMTAVAGKIAPVIEIVVDGNVAATGTFTVIIDENPVPESAIESTDEFLTIQQLAAQVQAAAKIVSDNEAAIQAVADNVDAIQQAPTAAANAAASATLAESWAVGGTGTREGENTNNAQYWCNQAQTIAQGALGWYESESALQAAHPTGQNGQWAIIGTTDTIWTWDEDTGAWVDTGAQIDLSNYYTKAQTDAQIKTAMSNTGTLVYGSSVTTGTVNNGGVGTIGTLKIPSAGVWMVAASGWKPDAIGKGIVSIDNIGGCSLSEYQFCLAGVMQCSGATTLNLNVTNWSGNTVNGQQSAGLIFKAVKISG